MLILLGLVFEGVSQTALSGSQWFLSETLSYDHSLQTQHRDSPTLFEKFVGSFRFPDRKSPRLSHGDTGSLVFEKTVFSAWASSLNMGLFNKG